MKDKKDTKQIKKCNQCKKERRLNHFYNSNSKLFEDGKSPICKNCIKTMIDYNNINSIYAILRTLDIPFDIEYWNKANKGDKDPFGDYMRMANSLHQLRGLGWEDSVFELKEDGNFTEESTASSSSSKNRELIEKWGDYPIEEIRLFEKKYQQLRVNYPERTAMHTEALLIYVRYRVKEELATQAGNVREAKEWGALAQKAAQDAKINPSQLSKADLSDGMDSFSQLVRSVEQAVDIIEILPRFKERPKDKADFTIWCYVNYIRDLKGLPLAEYKDIYEFYEKRKKEYEKMTEAEENG